MIIALQLLSLLVAIFAALFTWRNHMSLENLQREVEEANTVMAGAIVFIQGIKQELVDAIAANNPAAFQNLANSLDAQANALSAALVKNTDAEDEGDETQP